MVNTISLRNTCNRQISKGGCRNRWDLVCLLDAARSDITIPAKGANGWYMPDLKVMQCECQCLEITISLLDKSSDGVIGFVVGLKCHCGFARPQRPGWLSATAGRLLLCRFLPRDAAGFLDMLHQDLNEFITNFGVRRHGVFLSRIFFEVNQLHGFKGMVLQ